VLIGVAAIYAFFLAVPGFIIALLLNRKRSWIPLVIFGGLNVLIDNSLCRDTALSTDNFVFYIKRFIYISIGSGFGALAASVPVLLVLCLWYVVRYSVRRARKSN
jgi:hypothetical protein